MQNFMAWEKAILIFSTIIAVIITLVGISFTLLAVFFPTLLPNPDFSTPRIGEIVKLGIGGWVGFVGVFTTINLIGLVLNLIRGKIK